jgi:hypothetical protein
MNFRLLVFLILLISNTLGCSLIQQSFEPTQNIPNSFLEIELEKEEIKSLNFIFHVFNDSLGNGNFQDRAPDIDWLRGEIRGANKFLSNVEKPIPLVGKHIKDSKIRFRIIDIKFWNSNNGAKAQVYGKYDHKDLYREFVLENESLTEFEKIHCVHVLLSGIKPRAYGGRNICMTRSCKDGFGFQNNVLYFEGMYQVYTKEFDIWGIGAHIAHEVGHGLGLGHYEHRLGPCASCEGYEPCPLVGCNNFMESNDGGKGMTECQMKLMHHLLKYGPRDSIMINPNSRAHYLIKDPPIKH